MRVITLAAFGFFSLFQLAAPQSLAGLPACATTCALNAIGATGCAATDAHCICTATSFLTSVAACISTACSPADQAATIQFAETFCLSANVTITPPSAPPATSSAPASSSAAASSAAPATAPASTTVASASTPPKSSQPAATYTGAAAILKQDWAGIMGVAALGMAAIL